MLSGVLIFHPFGGTWSFRTQYLARYTRCSRGDYTAETAVSGSISRLRAPIALRCHSVSRSGVLRARPFGGTCGSAFGGTRNVHADLGTWGGRGHDRTRAFGGTLGSGTRLTRPSGVPAAHLASCRTRRPSQSLFGGTYADLAESTARGGLSRQGPLGSSLSISLHTETSRSRGAAAAKFVRKSRRRRAYPQQIVTTRLLYCLQDPFAHLSRLQRI